MKFTSGSGGDYPCLEEDVYLARVAGITDLGEQDTKYGMKPQMIITYELVTETVEGLPYHQSQFFGVSLNEKSNFYKLLKNLGCPIPDDDSFDVSVLLTKPVQLNISKSKNAEGYDRNKIESVSKVMKGTDVPHLVNSPYFLNLDDSSWPEVFKTIPEWQQKLVNTDSAVKSSAGVEEGDIPFEEEDSW